MIDIRLPADGGAVEQRDTPHGILRTVFTPAGNQDAALHIRYDDERLLFAAAEGPTAPNLITSLIEWSWDHFDADNLVDFLQEDARRAGEGDDAHRLLVGKIDRREHDGVLHMAWVGAVGSRVYNLQRDIHPLNLNSHVDEGWSPQRGVFPASARPLTQDFVLNNIDRILIYASSLTPLADELPYLGRATLSRVAETYSEHGTVFLFDLHPLKVLPPPTELELSYRWESPTEVVLSWAGSHQASGFIIEESATPRFETYQVVAELTDHRQHVYTIQPPFERDVYYRVVPINDNVRGEPSTPVIVTPVPLVPPQIEKITWSIAGNLRVQWTDVPQADTYELESSPSQDFDSAYTNILYKGNLTAYEIDKEQAPTGWYFRVRSRNSHYKPKVPSIWSPAMRSPTRLATPTFRIVSPAMVTWTPIDGALRYEVRQKLIDSQPIIAQTERPRFVPPETDAAYEVRAIRRENEEQTASDWSGTVTIGGASMSDFLADILEPDEDSDTLPLATVTSELVPARSSTGWRNLAILMGMGLGLVLFGLMAGLIGGPQLGIGIDPSPTPITNVERTATAVQEAQNQENRIRLLTSTAQVGRMNVLATENVNQLNNLQTRNANLADSNRTAVDAQGTLNRDIVDLAATGTHYADMQGTLVGNQNQQLDNLEGTINAAEIFEATFEAERDQLYATATAQALTEATLEAELEAMAATAELVPTATRTPSPTPSPTLLPSFGWVDTLLEQLRTGF